jgi:hypothetical protein
MECMQLIAFTSHLSDVLEQGSHFFLQHLAPRRAIKGKSVFSVGFIYILFYFYLK